MSGDDESGPRQEPLEVVIAGGGVAAAEALLALSDLAGDRARVQLLAPDPEFVFRPMLVAEPFGLADAKRVGLAELAAEHGASYRQDALVGVDLARRAIRTRDGERLEYEALLIALGATPIEAVPGALTFSGQRERSAFRELLRELPGDRPGCRLVFTAPAAAKWTIAVYELALLTAAHLAARAVEGVQITVVTHEPKPLDLFGQSAPQIVADMLRGAGIEVRTASPPISFEKGLLEVADGEPVAADHVVALPALDVPPIPGVPQRHNGFIPTDVRMNVEGVTQVWAAGDATWFPVKQGGLAAAQADVAAEAIAGEAGVHLTPGSFRPVLRAALLTGALPRYLRSAGWDGERFDAAPTALWWPPGKLAGRYLAPYLARRWKGEASSPLRDLDAPHGGEAEAYHRDAVEFALAAADADASSYDFAGALEWLEVVERFNMVVPPAHAERRRNWKRALDGEAPTPAGGNGSPR
jgi:sulfide:quinone oxidoreductase